MTTPDEHIRALEEKLAILDELDRRAARDSFLRYYCRMTGFTPPKHVRAMAAVAQALEEDTVDRAMVFLPPRHAKTTMFSHLLPSWIMGRHPAAKLMSVAHTQKYAAKIGRNVRNLTYRPEYPFELRLAEDSQAKDQWATEEGGEYNAFGVIGGNQHGNPAEWLFMDDLVKGRKIALSEHMRDEVWETYRTDLMSRLQGRRKQVMIFTRWHLDDPAGRILPESFDGRTGWYRDRETGEKWYVLSLPAVAEHDNDPIGRKPGEWLWPEHFGEKQLGGLRRRGGWVWSALFQQRPSPETGLFFDLEDFKRYDPHEIDLTRLTIYGSSDYAVTTEAGSPDPDYTVHLVWGVDPDWNVYLLDGWRGRTKSNVWVEKFLALVLRWNPLRWFEEDGQIIKGIGPFLVQRMREEGAAVNRVQMVSSTGKEQRAYAMEGAVSLGRVYLPRKDRLGKRMLELVEAFEKELGQFPTGKHDDTVDAATLFFRGLNRIIQGSKPARPQMPHDSLEALYAAQDDEEARRKRRR